MVVLLYLSLTPHLFLSSFAVIVIQIFLGYYTFALHVVLPFWLLAISRSDQKRDRTNRSECPPFLADYKRNSKFKIKTLAENGMYILFKPFIVAYLKKYSWNLRDCILNLFDLEIKYIDAQDYVKLLLYFVKNWKYAIIDTLNICCVHA